MLKYNLYILIMSQNHKVQMIELSQFESELPNRLDVFLSNYFKNIYSRNMIQNFIKQKKIQILENNVPISEKKIKPSLLLKKSMKILIKENLETKNYNSYTIEPKPLDMKILYEDEYLAIIHKPPGISVHPGPNEKDSITILNGILYHWKNLQNYSVKIENHNITFRPGIVHRLDKNTEGILIIAKNISTQWKLSRLFLKRAIKKTYIAWILGVPPEEKGTIELPLKRSPKNRLKMQVDPSGRNAITQYEILKTIVSNHHRKYTKLKINLITGRTHQIRAHFHHLKCPIVGDDLYYHVDDKIKKYGLLLLAKEIDFIHPETQQHINIEIEEPERFKEFEFRCKFY